MLELGLLLLLEGYLLLLHLVKQALGVLKSQLSLRDCFGDDFA